MVREGPFLLHCSLWIFGLVAFFAGSLISFFLAHIFLPGLNYKVRSSSQSSWCRQNWGKVLETDSLRYKTGWWFGTFFIFAYIGNNNPNLLICFRGVETTNQKMFERVSQLRKVFYRRTGAKTSYWSTKRDVSTCFVGNVHLPASQSNRWNDIFDMSNLLNMAHKLVSVKMLKIIFHDFCGLHVS